MSNCYCLYINIGKMEFDILSKQCFYTCLITRQMAKLDGEDIELDDIEETTDDVVDETIDDVEEAWEEEITYEQAIAWKERLEKAEKALVEKKRAEKNKKKEDTPINSKEEIKRYLAEERFYDKNPEAESYRENIEKYQEKGLSLEDSYLLATKQDKDVEEKRSIYWKSFIKWATNKDELSIVSLDNFDKMPISAQSEYIDKMTAKYWKVKYK